MKIILTEDVQHLGSASQLISVKDGYARNFLIPNGKAIMATTQNLKNLEHQKRLIQEKLNKTKRLAEGLARKIEAISCTIPKPVGEEDKIFGSVTTADVQNCLKNEGLDIDKKKILLEEPIRSLGIFSIPIKLHSEITANLKVWVVKE